MLNVKKAVKEISAADKRMAALIEKAGPCRLEVNAEQSPFHALARSIIYQQLNGTAAGTIHKRMLALFPKRKHLAPEDILKTDELILRGAGVSRSKIAALKDLSAKTLEGLVPTAKEIHALSDDELIERLTQIRGIGRWTVEMLLIFHLGRPDVLPATDYGVRNGFAITFRKRDLPSPVQLLEYGEKWKPYRTVASWYLWRAVDLSRGSVPK